jgi:purine-cytosine permease-like protein
MITAVITTPTAHRIMADTTAIVLTVQIVHILGAATAILAGKTNHLLLNKKSAIMLRLVNHDLTEVLIDIVTLEACVLGVEVSVNNKLA